MNVFRVTALVSLVAIAGCTAGQTGAPAITSVNPSDPNYSKLQLSVGTANLYGAVKGLNVVSTLRQPNGLTALGVDTPTITGPFSFGTAAAAPAVGGNLADPYTTIPDAGPSLPETTAASPEITGTSQLVTPGTPFCDGLGSVPSGFTACPGSFKPNATSFGQSGGVFANGIAPYNDVASTAQAYSYAPYTQPIYDSGSTVPAPGGGAGFVPTFVPWGGPPAFDPDGNGMGTRDGLVPLGVDSFNQPYFLGVPEGITVFEGLAPRDGSYSLKVDIATVGNNGVQNVTSVSKSASLNPGILLPTITAPAVTPDSSGDGGATFSVTLPAGVKEELVQIVDWGPGGGPEQINPNTGTPPYNTPNCHGPKGTSFAPVYYTVEVSKSGAYNLPAKNGPDTNLSGGNSNLTPAPSICTAAQNTAALGVASSGDSISIQAIGFDYPMYEAAVSITGNPGSIPQTPAISGSSGQADITISYPTYETDPGYAPTPLSVRRTHGGAIRGMQMHRAASPRPLVIPRFVGVPQI